MNNLFRKSISSVLAIILVFTFIPGQNFNVKADDTVTFTYEADPSDGGSVNPKTESLSPTGAVKGSTAKANKGYKFDKWVKVTKDPTGNEIEKTESYDATFIPKSATTTGYQDTTYRAKFLKTATIYYKAGKGGKVDPTSEEVPIDAAKPLGSKAEADKGYKFLNWTNKEGKIISEKPKLEFPYGQDYDKIGKEKLIYTANFEKLPTVTITYNASKGGFVSPESEEVEKNGKAEGSEAFRYPNYTFINWVDETGKEVSKNRKFIPKPDPREGYMKATYTAIFEPNPGYNEDSSEFELDIEFITEHGTLVGTSKYSNKLSNETMKEQGIVAPNLDSNEYTLEAWTPAFDENKKPGNTEYLSYLKMEMQEGNHYPTTTLTFKASLKKINNNDNAGDGEDNSINDNGNGNNNGNNNTNNNGNNGNNNDNNSPNNNENSGSNNEDSNDSGNTDNELPKPKLNTKDHFAYIQGYSDGTIKPDKLLTREEVTAVFYRLLDADYKKAIESNKNNFSDVSEGKWSNEYISTLAKGKIIKGYKDGTFKPHNNITRAEVAAIASRFDNLEENKDHQFTDIKGHWAEKYIASAVKKGWINGYEDKTFKPNQYISRAELISFINNVLNRHVKLEDILEGTKEFSDLQNKEKWYYCPIKAATNSYEYEMSSVEEQDSNSIKYQKWTKLIDPDIED